MKPSDAPITHAIRNDPAEGTYEAPGIEAVLTPEELEREILYGGDGTPPIMML
jgi:hypothetical protein